MNPAPAFPLAGAVALVGSRHGSPYSVPQFAAAVVAAGGRVVTGCARGVDHTARTTAAQAGKPATVYQAAGPQAYQLARRTVQVVHAAAAVAVFPPAPGALALGPGSRLALRTAQARALPVFVAGPTAPAGPGWSLVRVAGVAGWLWLPPMPALF